MFAKFAAEFPALPKSSKVVVKCDKNLICAPVCVPCPVKVYGKAAEQAEKMCFHQPANADAATDMQARLPPSKLFNNNSFSLLAIVLPAAVSHVAAAVVVPVAATVVHLALPVRAVAAAAKRHAVALVRATSASNSLVKTGYAAHVKTVKKGHVLSHPADVSATIDEKHIDDAKGLCAWR